MSADLAGVIPITVTPLDDRGPVHEAGVATLVDVEAGWGGPRAARPQLSRRLRSWATKSKSTSCR